MKVESRIFVAALLGVPFLTCVADVTVSAVTGTSCTISWDAVENAESYCVTVDEAVEPFQRTFDFAVDYGSDDACYQALESMGISYSHITPFYYWGYTVCGICLGDDWTCGYIELPAVPHSGTYRLSASGYAYAQDMFATLYVYESYPDGKLLQYKKFCNSDDYYMPEQLVCELSLEAGTRLVLQAGIENIDGEKGVNGRVVLQNVVLEELTTSNTLFREKFDEQTLSCMVEGLQPKVRYLCRVTAITDEARIIETAELTTLPCTEIFPLPDSEIAYTDLDLTSRMRIAFAQPVAACDVTKITITPANWVLAAGESQAAVRLVDSGDVSSVMFQVNSWNSCLEGNTRYTIAFASGAVTFVDGTASPAFSYTLTTGAYPTALHVAEGDNASISRCGDFLLSADGNVLHVYDVMGHRVMSGIRLDISSLPHGIYIVRSATSSMKLLL